jgi:hypothetical protein
MGPVQPCCPSLIGESGISPDRGHLALDPSPLGFETNTVRTGRERTDALLPHLDSVSSTSLLLGATRCHHHPSSPLWEISSHPDPGMCSTPHARLNGRASTLLGRSVSLRKISPSLPSPVSNTLRRFLPISRRKGARLRDHGLCLTKGRRMPTHKGSNIAEGQYAHPGETTNEKSQAL